MNRVSEGGLTTAEARALAERTLAEIDPMVEAYYSLPADKQKSLSAPFKKLEDIRIKLSQTVASIPMDDTLSQINDFELQSIGMEQQAQDVSNELEGFGSEVPLSDVRRYFRDKISGIGDDVQSAAPSRSMADMGILDQLMGVSAMPTPTTNNVSRETPDSNSLFRMAGRGMLPALESASEGIGRASSAAAPYLTDTLMDMMSLGQASASPQRASEVVQLPQAVADPIDGTRVQNVTKADVMRWKSRGVSPQQMISMGVPPEWVQ